MAFVAVFQRRNYGVFNWGKRHLVVVSEQDGMFSTRGGMPMKPGKKSFKPKKSNVQLMFSTHDPLEEINRAERAQEDDYFRKLDQELMVALREKSAEELEQAIQTYTRMRCPKCGEPLEATLERRVMIDACPGCGGIWLDKGEWEGLAGLKENGWLQRFFAGLIAFRQ
jgi:formylmethanofuran dehydrogenase subunit E